jgi:beta-xylosidase
MLRYCKSAFYALLSGMMLLVTLSTIGANSKTQRPPAQDIQKKASVTTFINPVINSDVPDVSVCRVGDDYYMISTTMHLMPGAPIMKSKDLVNWETIGYVFDRIEDAPNYSLLDSSSVYGRGQWASSIRYHNGKFYVMFATNGPHAGFIYSAVDPAGKWERVSKLQQFHDPSLFFDDDGRVYVFYGTGEVQELKSDLSGVKPDGLKGKTFQRGSDERGLLEGTQVLKKDGKYYMLMITMGRLRSEVCYRADNISGPWEKKVILETAFDDRGGVGQGNIVDTKDGRWFGVFFQDRGGIGRVPTLMPCRWIDGWPILGDENGNVPKVMEKPIQGYSNNNPIVNSDAFDKKKLSLNWQWNHNPVDEAWSLSERPGFLRLKTSRVVPNLYLAPNTLTQRTEGPMCSGTIALDLSRMKDGDVAGFCAFNGHSGLLSVLSVGAKKYLTMSTNVVDLNNPAGKIVRGVAVDEKARVELTKNTVFLRIDMDFNLNRDLATFFYSLDNKNWIPIGTEFKMRFDHTKLFMGTRFAIFNYATKSTGGFVDIDFFSYQKYVK